MVSKLFLTSTTVAASAMAGHHMGSPLVGQTDSWAIGDNWRASAPWGHVDLWVGVSMGVYNELQLENDGKSCFSQTFNGMLTFMELSKYFDTGRQINNWYEGFRFYRDMFQLGRDAQEIFKDCMYQYREAQAEALGTTVEELLGKDDIDQEKDRHWILDFIEWLNPDQQTLADWQSQWEQIQTEVWFEILYDLGYWAYFRYLTPELRERFQEWYYYAIDIYELGFDVVWFVYTTITPQYYFLFDGIFVGKEVYRTYIKTWKYYELIKPEPEPEEGEAIEIIVPREGIDNLEFLL